MDQMSLQVHLMDSFASDFREISRSVNVLPDRVIKTIKYSGEPQTIEFALTGVKQVFDEIENLRDITTVKFLAIDRTGLTVHQTRTRSKRPTEGSNLLQFTNEVMQANRSGWIFGDLNYKNVVFDGVQFKVIDFEPFTKVIRNERVEYQVTPPYFHPLDKISTQVSAYTDRLGLIGLHLRLKFGLRKQREIFSAHASTLHDMAVTEGRVFIETLKNLDKMHA